MTPYINPNSGITDYEIGDDYISIRFSSGKIYTYLISKIGIHHFNNMVELAEKGEGLNSYINKNSEVKYGFQ
jgi:hypothetical protein